MRARLATLLVMGLVWAFAPGGALAQTQIIIPWPAGGGTDIIGRLLQNTLTAEIGQQVVLRNVGGAAGTIGTAEVVRSRPDGTTLLMTSLAPIVIMPSFRPSIPYRVESLAPVCLIADAPAVLMTPQNSGLRTVADIVARARAAPGQFPYASGGVGALGHIAMTGLQRAAGIELNHIPFRGSGDSVLAMQQGTVALLTAEANLVRQYGLHAIGVFAAQRMPEYPDAPTMREQGIDLVFPLWTGLFAPAGTPDDVVARLDAACARSLRVPSIVEGMGRVGHPIRYLDRTAFTRFVREEAVKYAGIIEAAGMRMVD
jgi:tripartite-type tricarboxylate transporter receptor subunit TctC